MLKDLELKYGSLQASYEELKTSHENLKKTHEKLEEAHNTLLDHKNNTSMEASSETCNYVVYLALLTPHVAQVICPLVMSHLSWKMKN
jgi:DNA repair exonuclease SbcCD ATPase subunit